MTEIYYNNNNTGVIDHLGTIGQKTRFKDIYTGEDLLVGDFVKIGLLSFTSQSIEFRESYEFSEILMIVSEEGFDYIFGLKGENIISLDSFGSNFRSNILTMLKTYPEKEFFMVVWKDNDRDVNSQLKELENCSVKFE